MKQTFLRRATLGFTALVATAAIISCDDDNGTGPVVTPTAVAAASTPPATAIAGLQVATGPAVVVTGAGGGPVAGVGVTFTVTAGNGTVQYPFVVTGSDGIASAGTWQIGAPGVNTITATVEGLPPVVFSLTAETGPATQLVKLSGDNQIGDLNTALPIPLSVQVLNAGGYPISGASVTFTVVGGGGSIAGSPATTNASGVAVSGAWTMGPNFATNTVVAQSGTVQATFNATVDPCEDRIAISVGQTANGSLAFGADRCAIAGAATDNYSLTTAVGDAVIVTVSSGAFDPRVRVLTPGGVQAASDDDSGTGNDASLKLITAAGTKTIQATSEEAAATGAYTLQVEATSAAVDDCGGTAFATFIEVGAVTNQTLTANCDVAFQSFSVWIPAGAQVRFEMVGTSGSGADRVDGVLILYPPTGAVGSMPFSTYGLPAGALAWADGQGSAAVAEVITFTATTAGFYRLVAVSYGNAFDDNWGHELGGYRLSVIGVAGF